MGAPEGLFPDALAIELYEHMVLARGVDEEAVNLQRQGQLGVYAPSRGQEAIQVAAALALDRDQDWVFPAYREMGTAVAWQIDPAIILHMWRGTWFSGYDYGHLRYGPQTIPLATQLLHATGFAQGAKFDGAAGVVLTFMGDGATSEGDCHEALNFAATWQVPCVFVLQNNGYAISVPVTEQTAAARLAFRGVGYGMPSIVVDGNDALASHLVVTDAVERARRGEGPSLIEALTYRLGPHTTSDDPSRYRGDDEVTRWQERDPLLRLRLFLEKRGLWDLDFAERLDRRVSQRRQRLRDAIYDAPAPDPMELFEHVYVDATGHFEDQRQTLRTELGSGGHEPRTVEG